MKGFIEVTDLTGNRFLVNVSHVMEIQDNTIFFERYNTDVKETYSELKALIEAATKQDGAFIPTVPILPSVQTIPLDISDWQIATSTCMEAPEISGFNGTRDALNNLGIREEKQNDR